MSLFSKISSLFSKIGSFVTSALMAANVAGLTDNIVKMALVWVREAAVKFTDNAEKREYVVNLLVGRGISESIARLAVELAVQLFKKEIENVGK